MSRNTHDRQLIVLAATMTFVLGYVVFCMLDTVPPLVLIVIMTPIAMWALCGWAGFVFADAWDRRHLH